MKEKKNPLPALPEKYPKHIVEGPSMDYSHSAYPKPTKTQKKSKWGKR